MGLSSNVSAKASLLHLGYNNASEQKWTLDLPCQDSTSSSIQCCPERLFGINDIPVLKIEENQFLNFVSNRSNWLKPINREDHEDEDDDCENVQRSIYSAIYFFIPSFIISFEINTQSFIPHIYSTLRVFTRKTYKFVLNTQT